MSGLQGNVMCQMFAAGEWYTYSLHKYIILICILVGNYTRRVIM